MSHENSLVSVIVPAYNHELYVYECLMSIYNQTYKNIELIIIDDGSTDSTPDIVQTFLEEYSGRFSNVKFRSRPNKGLSSTLNEMLSLCRGVWIFPLASDDKYCTNKIELIIDAYKTWNVPEIALIYGDTLFMDMDGNPIDMPKDRRPLPGPDYKGYLELFMTNPLGGPCMAYRRQAIEAIGGFDESLPMEDWDCWLRLSARFPIARVPENVSYYRYHPYNSCKAQTRMLSALLKTFGKFLQSDRSLLSDAVIRRNWRKNLHRIYRWARKSDPKLLPILFVKAVKSLFTLPSVDEYFYFSDRIRSHIDY